MKSYEDMEYFPPLEKLLTVIKQRVQSNNPHFFRLLLSYHYAKMASSMGCKVRVTGQVIPINMYAVNLGLSGIGKGHSTDIIESEVVHKFYKRYMDETMPEISERNLALYALNKADIKGTTEEEEFEKAKIIYKNTGAYLTSFDSGTSPAFKQLRIKAVLGGIGSLNFECDEIASNLLANTDLLTVYFETFEKGNIKAKLIKHTAENPRGDQVTGMVPTNMMLFGTPVTLLNGSKLEDTFREFFIQGYARRCFCCLSDTPAELSSLTPEEMLDALTDTSSTEFLKEMSDFFATLASPDNFDRIIDVPRDVGILLMEYRKQCDTKAYDLPIVEETARAELSHRHSKVIRLSAAFAFGEGALEVSKEHLYNAIKLAEDSGESFKRIFNRDKPYVRLAKYLGTTPQKVTAVDLTEALPFFKGTESARREMMTLAATYGLQHNISITTEIIEGISFYEGASLEETDLSSIIISYSNDPTTGYINRTVPFDKMLSNLLTIKNHHWVNHYLEDGYRDTKHIIQGNNLIVLDVDEGSSLNTVIKLLEGYVYVIHTTKRHTPAKNRFRVVMPLSHKVELDSSTYSEFMENIYEWLPFDVDTATKDQCRKWATAENAHTYVSTGTTLLNAFDFIPRTNRSNTAKQRISDMSNIAHLERWFLRNADANRNNTLIKYAYVLIEKGLDEDVIKSKIMTLNSNFNSPLPENEILSTVLLTVAKKLATK